LHITLPGGSANQPRYIVLSPDGKQAYVTSYHSNARPGSVSIIDTDPTSNTYNQVSPYSLSVPGGVYATAINNDGTQILFPSLYGSDVYSFTRFTEYSYGYFPIGVGSDSALSDVAFSADGTRAYLTDVGQGSTGRVIVIDTDRQSPFFGTTLGALTFDQSTQRYPTGRLAVGPNNVYIITDFVTTDSDGEYVSNAGVSVIS